MENKFEDRALDWNDPIERESDYQLLPVGDYDFQIVDLERSRYDGGDKIPACHMAIIHCKISAPEGEAVIRHRLFLHTKTEWALSQFFTSIGLKKKGEPLVMNWNQVPGAIGRCTLGTYIGNDDNTYNQIKKFLPKTEKFTPGMF